MTDKDQLKAEARAKAQKEAVEAKKETVAEYRQSVAEAATEKEVVVTEAAGDALEEYGPYDDFRDSIPTSQGENAVPYGEVLFFVEEERFDTKINRMVKFMAPHYRKATPEEMAPIRERRARRKAALAGAKGR